jgi:hypothetical protein
MGIPEACLARMRVPKMVKNGFKSIFVYVGSLWICLMSVFWLCLRNKNHFKPISGQASALLFSVLTPEVQP